MNLPNKLTLLRIVLILPFLLVLYLGIPGASYIDRKSTRLNSSH